MRRKWKQRCLLAWGIVLIMRGHGLRAENGRTGAVLLQTPFGARPFALGQAYAALGDDAFGIFYNPASISRLRESQFASQFIRGLVDTNIGYGAFATPLNPAQALGLGIAYMDLGMVDVFDDEGKRTAAVNAQSDLLIHFAYAYSLSTRGGRLNLGIGTKLLRSTIFEEMQSLAFAADTGGLWEIPLAEAALSAAAVVSNLGPPLRYSGGLASGAQADPLPLTARLGAGYSRPTFASDNLAFGIQIDRRFFDDQLAQRIGLEYEYRRLIALRLGHVWSSNVGRISLGLGLRFKNLSMDYGLGLAQAFNNIQHLSLTYRFSIPGIRYFQAHLSPLEGMMRNVRNALAAQRYFEADEETRRMRMFFPADSNVEKYLEQIEAEIRKIISSGPYGPRYDYAAGFKHYQGSAWQEAVASLKSSLSLEPQNEEIRKYLGKAERKWEEQRRQQKIEQQAAISTLFDLANRAFELQDYGRSARILDEILKIAPYQPADSLKNRIRLIMTAPPKPAAKPVIVEKPSQLLPLSPEKIARAEELYWEALRNYRGGAFENSLKNIREGLELHPASENLKNTLELIERAYKKRRESQQSQGMP